MAKRKPSRESMIEHEKRIKINDALREHGFDGNGRFTSNTNALSEMQGVLHSFGIELDQVLSAHEFNKPSGNALIYLAYSNRADPFSPKPIDNAAVAFFWHRLSPRRVEAIAYVS